MLAPSSGRVIASFDVATALASSLPVRFTLHCVACGGRLPCLDLCLERDSPNVFFCTTPRQVLKPMQGLLLRRNFCQRSTSSISHEPAGILLQGLEQQHHDALLA